MSGCRGRDPGEVGLQEVVGGEDFWIVEEGWWLDLEIGGVGFSIGGGRLRASMDCSDPWESEDKFIVR